MRSSQGLTLLETIVAIAICAIILSALATVATSSLRESRSGNFKTQATQVLDTVGRRIAGGYDESLLTTADSNVTLDADEIVAMTNIDMADVADMSVVIDNLGTFDLGTTSLARYSVEVCYGANASRRCVEGVTLGKRGN